MFRKALIGLCIVQSVSSEEAVPVFELSRGSTVSSDNGVYPLRTSEGDDQIPDDDSLEGGESDEAVFVEPQVNNSSYLTEN